MHDLLIADYTSVLLASIAGVALVAILLTVSRFLAPRQPSREKSSVYECGMLPIGQYWSQVHVRYYLFAILFLIFDVEAVFIYPWALTFRGIGPLAFWEMMIFIALLLFGLVYAWKKGVLQWK